MKRLRETFRKFESAGNYTLDWKQLGSVQNGTRRTRFTFRKPREEAVHEVKHSDMTADFLSLVRRYKTNAVASEKKKQMDEALKGFLRKQ